MNNNEVPVFLHNINSLKGDLDYIPKKVFLKLENNKIMPQIFKNSKERKKN